MSKTKNSIDEHERIYFMHFKPNCTSFLGLAKLKESFKYFVKCNRKKQLKTKTAIMANKKQDMLFYFIIKIIINTNI